MISQVFSDGGAEDPATGDSAKFERTEGVATGAVGNLVPHPELHLGGTFFFFSPAFFFVWESLGEGGLEGIFHAHHWIRVCSCCCCISLLVSLQQMGCSYAASNFMEPFCPEKVRTKDCNMLGQKDEKGRMETWTSISLHAPSRESLLISWLCHGYCHEHDATHDFFI